MQGMNPVPVEVDVSGMRFLEITASTDVVCGGAPRGYASLVQSYVY